ncbi:MBL fold metallo-hydrolase [Candidatus Woesearchaeota archaeon]|nr:MBL fold metallo-hydrolase [Candidatus Woesearchaeota archaeon]
MTAASSLVSNIRPGIWKVHSFCNVYVLEGEEPTVIDTGARSQRQLVKSIVEKIVPLDKVVSVLLTHLHYDHCGNADLFPNATIYASEEELKSFRNDPEGTVLDKDTAAKLAALKLTALPSTSAGLEVIPTPGHTKGSVCFWHPKERILFSGDTLFAAGIGRTDLPTSVPEQLPGSLSKLVSYNFKTLCAGHD